jgi:hypothetical protein
MDNMEKFKYIIIFLLALLLGLTYYQMEQYQKISQKLISENNYLDKEIEKLNLQNRKNQEVVNVLNAQVDEQTKMILSLEQNLTGLLSFQPAREDFRIDHKLYNEPEDKNVSYGNKEDDKFSFPVEPKVNLDENNEVESLEIKIKKSF